MPKADIQKLFDTEGNFIGVFLPAPIWAQIAEIVEQACQQEEAPCPEPLSDWEQLCAYWDFSYPVEASVTCNLCGSSSPDWREDDPRKFLLLTASLGGLASWRCQSCAARVTKYHFKDKISYSCEPYLEKK